MNKQTVQKAAQKPMKQTLLEAAAAAEYEDVQVSFFTMQGAYLGGAQFGGFWQKEQGIDWIDKTNGLPETKHGFLIDVLVTDGIYWGRGTYNTGESIWLTPSVNITHWAYINLPK